MQMGRGGPGMPPPMQMGRGGPMFMHPPPFGQMPPPPGFQGGRGGPPMQMGIFYSLIALCFITHSDKRLVRSFVLRNLTYVILF